MRCPQCKALSKGLMEVAREAAEIRCGPVPPKVPKEVLYKCKYCKILFDEKGKIIRLGGS